MKFLFMILISIQALFSVDLLVGIENNFANTKKIQVGNNGTKYYLGSYDTRSYALTLSLDWTKNIVGMYLEKETLTNDEVFAFGLLYHRELFNTSTIIKIPLESSVFLDTNLGYNYKSFTQDSYGGSAIEGKVGLGMKVNYKQHIGYTVIGFAMDYTTTQAVDMTSNRNFLYYNIYLKFGYEYRFHF